MPNLLEFKEIAAGNKITPPDPSNPMYTGEKDENGQIATGRAIELALTALAQAKADLAAKTLKITELEGVIATKADAGLIVDDILEFANVAAFPATGLAGKIYVDLSDNGKQYRWSGSTYTSASGTGGQIKINNQTSDEFIIKPGLGEFANVPNVDTTNPANINWNEDYTPLSVIQIESFATQNQIEDLTFALEDKISGTDAVLTSAKRTTEIIDTVQTPANPLELATVGYVKAKAAVGTTVNGLPSVKGISVLPSYTRGSAEVVVVGDGRAGGEFLYSGTLASGTAVDNINIFPAAGGGFWIRQNPSNIIQAGYSEYLAGANELAKLQSMINLVPNNSVVQLKANYTYTSTVGLILPKPVTLLGLNSTISVTSAGKVSGVDIQASNTTVDGVNTKSVNKDKNVTGHMGIYAMPVSERTRINESTINTYLKDIRIINCKADGFGDAGIYLHAVDKFLVEKSDATNCAYSGIDILSCQKGQVNKCFVKHIFDATRKTTTSGSNGSLNYGIALNTRAVNLRPACDKIDVTYNHIEDLPQWEGYDTHAGTNLTVIGNTLVDCKRAIAITEDSVGRVCHNIAVESNHVYNEKLVQAAHNIYVYFPDKGATNITIIDNRFFGMGINIRGTIGAQIKGNRFIRCMNFGVKLIQDNINIDVDGNYFEDIYGVDPIQINYEGVITPHWTNESNCIQVNEASNSGWVRNNWSYRSNRNNNRDRSDIMITGEGYPDFTKAKIQIGTDANGAYYKYPVLPALSVEPTGSTSQEVHTVSRTIRSVMQTGIVSDQNAKIICLNNNFEGVSLQNQYRNITTAVTLQGNGVPTVDLPNGSVYYRKDPGTGAVLYVRQNGAWVAK